MSVACRVRPDALDWQAYAMHVSHIKPPMCTMGAEFAPIAPPLDVALPVLMVVALPAHQGSNHFLLTRRQPVSAVESACSVLSVKSAFHVHLEAFLSQRGSHAVTVHRVGLRP